MNYLKLIGDVRKYISKVKLGKKLIDDIEFLIDSMKKHPLKYGAIVVVALLYLLNPIDVIPDTIPIVGWADDAGVIATAVATIKRMMGT